MHLKVSTCRDEVTEQTFIKDQNWNFWIVLCARLFSISTTNCQLCEARTSQLREYSAHDRGNQVNTIKLPLSLLNCETKLQEALTKIKQ